MSFGTEDIVLTADIHDIRVQTDAVQLAWDELDRSSVETALSGHPSMEQFVDGCLYFAAIQHYRKNMKEDFQLYRQDNILYNPSEDITFSASLYGGTDGNGMFVPAFTSNTPMLPTDEYPAVWNTTPTPTLNAQLTPSEIPHPSSNNDASAISRLPPTDSTQKGARRKERRARRKEKRQASSSDSESDTVSPPYHQETIGLVYVYPSTLPSEVFLGIVLLPPWRSLGLATQAVTLVLDWAIREVACHRVTAALLHTASPTREKAHRIFTCLGFAHEGTRRRAVPAANREWCDVTYLGLLDTEWIVRDKRPGPGAPKSMWDELFARHQCEREELLRWEERQLKRTVSTETIRVPVTADANMVEVETSTESSEENSEMDEARPSSWKASSDIKVAAWVRDTRVSEQPDDSEIESGSESWERDSDMSDAPSNVSYVSVPGSRASSVASSSNSAWDLLETGSVGFSTMSSEHEDSSNL